MLGIHESLKSRYVETNVIHKEEKTPYLGHEYFIRGFDLQVSQEVGVCMVEADQ